MLLDNIKLLFLKYETFYFIFNYEAFCKLSKISKIRGPKTIALVAYP